MALPGEVDAGRAARDGRRQRARHRRRPPVGARRHLDRPRPHGPPGARVAVRHAPPGRRRPRRGRAAGRHRDHGRPDLSDWLDRPVQLTRADTGRAGRYEIAADFEDEARVGVVPVGRPQGHVPRLGPHPRVGVGDRIDRRLGSAAVPRQRHRRRRGRGRRERARRSAHPHRFGDPRRDQADRSMRDDARARNPAASSATSTSCGRSTPSARPGSASARSWSHRAS